MSTAIKERQTGIFEAVHNHPFQKRHKYYVYKKKIVKSITWSWTEKERYDSLLEKKGFVLS